MSFKLNCANPGKLRRGWVRVGVSERQIFLLLQRVPLHHAQHELFDKTESQGCCCCRTVIKLNYVAEAGLSAALIILPETRRK